MSKLNKKDTLLHLCSYTSKLKNKALKDIKQKQTESLREMMLDIRKYLDINNYK